MTHEALRKALVSRSLYPSMVGAACTAHPKLGDHRVLGLRAPITLHRPCPMPQDTSISSPQPGAQPGATPMAGQSAAEPDWRWQAQWPHPVGRAHPPAQKLGGPRLPALSNSFSLSEPPSPPLHAMKPLTCTVVPGIKERTSLKTLVKGATHSRPSINRIYYYGSLGGLMGVQSHVKRRREEQYYCDCAPSTETLGQGDSRGGAGGGGDG